MVNKFLESIGLRIVNYPIQLVVKTNGEIFFTTSNILLLGENEEARCSNFIFNFQGAIREYAEYQGRGYDVYLIDYRTESVWATSDVMLEEARQLILRTVGNNIGEIFFKNFVKDIL